MKKVVLWGTFMEYDLFSKWFELECLKGNMTIDAIILNEENLLLELDGIPVIAIEELLAREYDYLIDMNRVERERVLRILELLKIPLDKVIPAKVFGQPFFDLKRWIEVKESRVSIIANNCWGGYTYNSLGLQFLSPFINMFVTAKDYLRLLSKFKYYMDMPLELVREEYEPVLNRNYPVVALDDVTIHFNHYTDFESAVNIWEKRKCRLNYDNLFIEMIIDTKEDLEAFLAVDFEHKIGFSTVPCNEEGIIYFPLVENRYIQSKYQGNTWNFFNHMAMAVTDEGRQYDVLKLLNSEKDFMRARMLG